jgi:hypothetical protein
MRRICITLLAGTLAVGTAAAAPAGGKPRDLTAANPAFD